MRLLFHSLCLSVREKVTPSQTQYCGLPFATQVGMKLDLEWIHGRSADTRCVFNRNGSLVFSAVTVCVVLTQVRQVL